MWLIKRPFDALRFSDFALYVARSNKIPVLASECNISLCVYSMYDAYSCWIYKIDIDTHIDDDDVCKQTTALKVLGECLVKGNLCYLYDENMVSRTYL